MVDKVVVVGAGSWGTTVASLVADRVPTVLWSRRPELAQAIATTSENPDYLPGFRLASGLDATSDLALAVTGADLVMMGVPSHGFRKVLEQAAPHLSPSATIISLTKGIEQGSLLRMTEVVREVLPGHSHRVIGVLSGPNLAREIAGGRPAASVVALRDEATARDLQQLLMSPTFRVYTNNDVAGCEIAGACKNVMAIAAGMAAGLGLGDNALAALVTRALAELARLGLAIGGNPLTFGGLAGVGDLVATCYSTQSRNHTVGVGLGEGRSIEEITAEMSMVAEGIKSTEGVLALADRHGVEMPIATEVGKVLYEGARPLESMQRLMTREAKAEGHGII